MIVEHGLVKKERKNFSKFFILFLLSKFFTNRVFDNERAEITLQVSVFPKKTEVPKLPKLKFQDSSVG